MAALPYMQLYIADYLGDTYFLTTEEHGAYLLILMTYWQSGKPIHKNHLAKAARLSNERWTDVEQTLNEFFTEDENGFWINERIEQDLDAVLEKSKQKSDAGKRSAAKRAQKRLDKENQVFDSKQELNERSTPVQRTSNYTDTDTDTDTDIKEKYKKEKFTPPKRNKDQTPYTEIIDLYHEKLPMLSQVIKLTDTRKRQIKKLWDNEDEESLPDLDHWENFFIHVSKSKFLTGKIVSGDLKPFKADLEWITKPSNYIKIAEDKYV